MLSFRVFNVPATDSFFGMSRSSGGALNPQARVDFQPIAFQK